MATKQKKRITSKRTKKKPQKTQKSLRASDVGHAVGAYLGGPIGAKIGSTAGEFFTHITGFGDYHINGNTLLTDNSVASFSSDGKGFRIKHREFVRDVSSSIAFSLFTLAVNPGVQDTFPWLSEIANNFDCWVPHGIIFEYRTTSGESIASTNTALGCVTMATCYDVYDPNFSNKQQMEAYEFSTSTVPSKGVLHPLECAPDSGVLNCRYVRQAASATPTGSALFYDLGTFQCATSGAQNANVIGELWVTYDIEFRRPRLSQSATYFAHITQLTTGTCTQANPWGPTGAAIKVNTVPYLTTVGGNVLRLPFAGVYTLHFIWGGNTITGNASSSGGSSCTQSPNLLDGDSVSNRFVTGAPTSMYTQYYTVGTQTSTTSNDITIVGPTTLTAGRVDCFVMYNPTPTA
jgi:hypothetical protein